MLKIKVFTNAISRKNGGSSSMLDLANAMVELNNEVTVITPFGVLDKIIYKPKDVCKKFNIKVVPKNIYNKIEVNYKKLILNKLMQLFAIKKIEKKSIIIDAIGLPSEYVKRLQSKNCKVIFNHAGSPNAVIKYFGMNGKKREDLEKSKKEYLVKMDIYDYILFQSPTQAKALFNMSNWEYDKTLVLRPSVSIKQISEINEKKSILDKNDFNIVIVGSVQQRKGQHLIPQISYEVSKAYDNVKFHIVGNIVDLDYKQNIENEAQRLGQENNIIFHGFKENYLEYMNSADIILQVSEEEGVSRILREAMALKKAIVSFRLDGTNDLLEDGKDCLLSDYGDTNGIANNILQLYKNKNLKEVIAKKAFENFNNKYSKKVYLQQLQNILKKVKDDN